MAKGSNVMALVGVWAFIIGVILALIAGFFPSSWDKFIVGILVLIGLIVGFLNVTGHETKDFLLASVAMLIALYTAGSVIYSNLAALGVFGEYMWSVMSNVNIFIFPATIVVAMKAIYALAKDA